MGIRFRLKRILMLIAVVILLSFVYFMVRAGYSVSIDNMKNRALLSVGQPAPIEAREKQSGWLVLEDPQDLVSASLRDAVDMAFSCLNYTPFYSASVSSKQLDTATEGVIVTATEWGRLGDVGQLLTYAHTGGTLVFAVRPEVDSTFRSIYQQFGIYEHGYFVQSQGINLQAGLLTKEPYIVEGDWLDNSIIELHVGQDCNVYATNDDGVPLIWSLPYGQGQILFMNNSLMTHKSTGGLLISLLAQINGPMIYEVVNARVMALEAFPLPTNINLNYMRQVYLRSGEAFLRDVWWGEMVRFSRTYNIPLTAGLLTGYESENEYPSASVMNEDMDLVFYAKELAKYDGELAFTGFNQKPLYFEQLTKDMDFEPWSGEELAAQRTQEALALFNNYFPQYDIYAFLPMERLLDQAGYELIRRIMPDLQVICGDFYNHQRWYQDFGVDENGIASFPAVSYGFTPSYEDEWNLLCVANALGVVFHYCDVSDLLLESDPDNSWNALSPQFFGFAGGVLRETDHLDGMTLTEASWRMRRMLTLDAEVRAEGNLMQITASADNMPEQVYFMLHCPGQKPIKTTGVTIEQIGAGRYFITSTIPVFTLELESE